MYCKNFVGFIVGIDGGETKIIRARCKKWDCDYCSKLNAMTWVYRVRDTVTDVNAWSFATFTCKSMNHGKAIGTDESLEMMQSAWKKFREAIRYKNGGTSPRYLRVYEIQQNGRYHIHCILEYVFNDIKTANKGKSNEYTYSRWIKDNVRKWGFGYMCDTQNFTRNGSDWRVAKYIAKYMTKGDAKIGKGVRRFQCSSGFAKTRASESDIDWVMVGDFTYFDLYQYSQKSSTIKDVTAGTIVTGEEVTVHRSYREYINKAEEKNDTS